MDLKIVLWEIWNVPSFCWEVSHVSAKGIRAMTPWPAPPPSRNNFYIFNENGSLLSYGLSSFPGESYLWKESSTLEWLKSPDQITPNDEHYLKIKQNLKSQTLTQKSRWIFGEKRGHRPLLKLSHNFSPAASIHSPYTLSRFGINLALLIHDYDNDVI